jgi:3-hydroxyacyl-[acyl-carrier-protein] dehydratase
MVSLVTPGLSAEGHKNFSFNEWFFPAHFEDEPVVPGFVLVESMTQMFLMTFLTLPENKGKKTGFVEISRAKFFRKVVPGDRLDLCASLGAYKRGIARGRCVGNVGTELCCEIELVVCIPDVLSRFRPISQ